MPFAPATWTPVPCEIVASKLIDFSVHGEVHFTAYRPDVLYRYQLGGVTYTSNAFNFTDFATPYRRGKPGAGGPIPRLAAAPPVTWTSRTPATPCSRERPPHARLRAIPRSA